MPPVPWHQHTIEFTDRQSAQQVITDTLRPALAAAEAEGLIHCWWYMNKQPWPLRYQAHSAPTAITDLLDHLTATGRIVSWNNGIYEPETLTFGGPEAMDAAHTLFHHDSRHLLTYAPAPTTRHLGRRESAILLTGAMMRAAGLDWYEQGDVWGKVTELRPHPMPLPPGRAAETTTAMRHLMSADTRILCNPGGPLAEHAAWVFAFEQAGLTLAYLARRGRLTRGLRAVLAHHVIFHANRAGLPLGDQSAMSTLAKAAVMGTSDTTASRPGANPDRTSLGGVNSDTIDTAATAEDLRNALVDEIIKEGRVRTPRIENTMRTVARHLFVPKAPLEQAYANWTVDIKQDTDGTSISCASQPGIVGLMLEQLQPQPGNKILELGAGTGYNAALLAHLTGPTGHVTTIDVDTDLVEGARSHLVAAGFDNVTVLQRDGALGHPDGAPYDRIIATVGAHGIPHAWLTQLAPDGLLLVPQRLRGSVSRSIAYKRRPDGVWASTGSEMNTFMPLRRGIADDERRIIPVTASGLVRLQTNSEQAVYAQALADVLNQPRTEVWSGVLYRAMESPEWMELFLSCSLPSGLNQMPFTSEARGGLLTDDPYPSSTAAFDGGALTYLARRLSDQRTPKGGKLWEFGVVGHGPGSDELANRVAEAMQTWDREYRDREARFELHPLDAAPVTPAPGRFTVDTPLNRIVIDWH
ncbi:methyltransferase, FxLD system [Kitasatospora indigofera]|uniref:methyltransferase, FxLD system n=1 Tax=Kitasatospora indigofera TaxID=67307 RepID=UPI0033B5AEC5